MISRRLLRIKALQLLYAYYKSDTSDLNKSEKELHFSINKAYELYYYLLILILDIVLYAEKRIEIARNKKIPTYEDLHPNTRFVDNKLIRQLRENEYLLRYAEAKSISWSNYPELIRELYNDILGLEEYIEYMKVEDPSYSADKKIIYAIFNKVIYPNENLHQVMEERSIYWNDDIDFVISMVVKTLKSFKEDDGSDKSLLEMYKNNEDKDFVIKLYRKSIVNRELSQGMIEEKASNWDLDRIAFMDVLIMQMAITELIEFSSIPTKVTLNEYLEIAKFYSTEKSNSFINGVLDKIFHQLKKDNKIRKTGRGLIGEI